MNELRGRVAVITGGASGIGHALCERFATEGMRIVLADINADAVAAAAERLADESGAETLGVAVDVSSWEQVDELQARTLERFGGVHVLCNNAGVQLPARAWEFTRKEWDWLIGVNLGGVIHGIRSFVPAMVASGQPGHVVNTASMGGLLAYPGIAMYTASKYAVVGLSETLAHDLRAVAAPIGVSVLCPGATLSSLRENSADLQPGGKVGREVPLLTSPGRKPAEEVAAMVVDAIRADRFWILTHPAYKELVRRRTEGIVETDELVSPPVI